MAAPAGRDRRSFLGSTLAAAALASTGRSLAQPMTAAPEQERKKGPLVWLDMDQAELDAAYDQSKYAANLAQITKRYATNSEGVRVRLGSPQTFSYGPTAIE